MKQAVITVGMPGSGKTTFARLLMQKHSSFVLVSKDEVRKAMFGSKKAYWKRVDGIGFDSSSHKHLETLVQNVGYDMAERAVIDNDVVICNTSFRYDSVSPYIHKLAKHAKISVAVFDIEINELLARNKRRPSDDRVSEKYLRDCYDDWCKAKERPWWALMPLWEDTDAPNSGFTVCRDAERLCRRTDSG